MPIRSISLTELRRRGPYGFVQVSYLELAEPGIEAGG